MMLITKPINAKLKANFAEAAEHDNGGDLFPALKLFFAASAATWLITERDPENPDLLFGLCDLGHGYPEIGYVSLAEMTGVRVMGLGIERDMHWTANKSLSDYADAARAAERIIA